VLVECSKRRDQGNTNNNPPYYNAPNQSMLSTSKKQGEPTSINLTCLAFYIHNMLVDSQHNDTHQTAH
jgi:hypothetical protein